MKYELVNNLHFVSDDVSPKIIFVCMGLGMGGTEKTLVEAVNAIDKSKYSVTVYLRKNRQDLVQLIDSNVHIIVNNSSPLFERRMYYRVVEILAGICKSIGLNGLEMKILRSLRKYVLKKRFEYEVSTYFSKEKYAYAVAYDMAEECIKIVSDGIRADKKIAFYHSSKLYESKEKYYMKFDRIIGVNDIVAQGICDDYPLLARKVSAIENYINPQWVYDELRNANPEKRPSCELILCSCGRIASGKGFDIAARAAGILKSKGISFHWFFVGDGTEREMVEKIIQSENISEQVTITGFKQNPFGFINMCDIYVQPSEGEAHATTMVESQILKKPIVSTNTVAGEYFLKKYSSCVLTDKTPESLAKGILELYFNEEKVKTLVKRIEEIDYYEQHKEYIHKINELFI